LRSRQTSLHQDVGLLDEPQHDLGTVGVLEVDGDRAPAAVEQLGGVVGAGADEAAAPDAVDAQDVGAEVGEQHRAEGPRADAADLDDADPGERAAHAAGSSS
jgi:hypothetical protein